MKKTMCLTVIVFLTISCGYKRERFEYANNDKLRWINTFKTEAFYACINEGINNDSLIFILRNKDLFNLYDGYPDSTLIKARGLGKNIIKGMPHPFIKIDVDETNMKDKNFVSYSCLSYYASRELDSIAKVEYKKFIKHKIN